MSYLLYQFLKIEDPNGKNPLTFGQLVNRVKRYMDGEHYNSFLKKQEELTQKITTNM